jgi:hypothetical protein
VAVNVTVPSPLEAAPWTATVTVVGGAFGARVAPIGDGAHEAVVIAVPVHDAVKTTLSALPEFRAVKLIVFASP